MCLYAGLDETGDEVQVRVIKAQVRPGAGVRVIGESGGQTDS